MSRFITATRDRFTYNLDLVCYYELQDNGKVKIHLANHDSKELEPEDARTFLTAVEGKIAA